MVKFSVFPRVEVESASELADLTPIEAFVRFFHFCSHWDEETWIPTLTFSSLLILCQTYFFLFDFFSNSDFFFFYAVLSKLLLPFWTRQLSQLLVRHVVLLLFLPGLFDIKRKISYMCMSLKNLINNPIEIGHFS